MAYQEEKYEGKIVGIDCRQKSSRETTPMLVEPKEFWVSRINVDEAGGGAHYELVSCDLPDSYLGKQIQVHNQTWLDEEGTLVVKRQEITSEGLEPIINMIIFK